MSTITWQDFEKVSLNIGTIIRAEEYPEARHPAYIIHVDLGAELGVKKSSAQITKRYRIDELIGKQVICVTNFPPKQIGKLMSEILVTGFPDEHGDVVLSAVDMPVPNGSKLF